MPLHLKAYLGVCFCLLSAGAIGSDPQIEVVLLPELAINGKPARVHTQGLEIIQGSYFVTGRREDVQPRQALLLRARPKGTCWDVWNITPSANAERPTRLDHPGGMQFDGARLWIPISQSKPNSSSTIAAFKLAKMVSGVSLTPEFEFSVKDHIGALAVASDQRLLVGANWDTEKVYVWDWEGHLKKTMTSAELSPRGLGLKGRPETDDGIAVQDWKVTKQGLFASGLTKNSSNGQSVSRSRIILLKDFLEQTFQRRTIILPRHNGVELGREAMAVSQGIIYLIPEDLGQSNRLFRVKLH